MMHARTNPQAHRSPPAASWIAPGAVATAALLILGLGCGDDGAPGNQNENNDNTAQALCGNGQVEGAEECDDGAANSDVAADACRTDCRRARCGDGTADTGEACDRGPQNSDQVPDACRTDCRAAGCGDGVVDVQAGETCDDGNPDPGDGCSATCKVEYCGNGVLDPGEACDDGNTVNGDACHADCTLPACGDGILDPDEGCDDGNLTPGDGCQEDCTLPRCGDGVIDSGEQCDDGLANSDALADACRTTCRSPRCGDHVVDSGEACDDGNYTVGDGCNGDCRTEACGNGVVDYGEECDDGNTANADACHADCTRPRCGDGVLDPGEGCDDGNTVNDDACHADCTVPRCGDGILDPGEECDDGNLLDADGCQATCVLPRCGDGIQDSWESCDCGTDAAALPPECAQVNSDTAADACRTTCLLPRCGDHVIDAGETCDDGGSTPGDGCDARCQREVCGNGVVDLGEQCDDGNLVSGDGCQGSCELPRCGDGVRDASRFEACDLGPGNSDAPDSPCRLSCQVPRCGDHILDPGLGEVCDDGNLISGDGCASDCRSDETCGNGVVDGITGEQCDDGDRLSHDGCSSGCTAEALTWIPFGARIPARMGHALVHDTGRNRLVLFGGTDGEKALDDTWEHDGTRWTRVVTARAPDPRSGAGIAYDANRQRVVLFGGSGVTGALGDTWEYDGAAWRRIHPAAAPVPRTRFAMTYDAARQNVVLMGGLNATGSAMTDTWTYDGVTWTGRAATEENFGGNMVWDSVSLRVVRYGGVRYGAPVNDLFLWNGTSWTKLNGATDPPKGEHPIAFDPARNRVVAYINGATWEWNGATWTNVAGLDPVPVARTGHRLVYATLPTAGSGVMLFGGGTAAGVWDDLWRYTGAWTEIVEASHPNRDRPCLAYDAARDRVVFFSGRDGSTASYTYTPTNYPTDTWEYDGDRWVGRTTPTRPGGRLGATCTYDPVNERVLLLGGYPSAVDRALWAYDGNDWQNLGTAPAAQEQRYHAALAYDEERHVLVLFGGQTPNGGTPLADTWEFSGTGWTERFPAHAPTARFAATMVYDRGLHRVVLHGGNPLGLGGTDGVTWTWNGTDWAPSNSPTTPGPRASAGGTYDDNLGCTVLFGGSTPYGAASDTWALCSGVWAQLYPALSPPPGAPFGIFYQGIHQRVLLIGADHRTDRDNYSLRWVSGWPDEQCWSQADDDHDGLVATEDPDCQLVPVEVCDSGQDDDGDGQVDCADADCVGRSCDAGLGRCEGGLCAHAVCGDGYVDLDRGEICDDGNVVSGDGCESDCTLTP